MLPFNPMDLRGPEFLIFYIGFTGVIWLLSYSIMYWLECQYGMPKLETSDPYEIAFLRGGANETLRVVTFNLIDRGYLKYDNAKLSTAKDGRFLNLRKPVELAVAEHFRSSGEPAGLFKNAECKTACEPYRISLSSKRLIANPEVKARRTPIFALSLIIVFGLALMKINVALSRGHSNIQFLGLLAFAAMFVLAKPYSRERTGLGDRMINDLQKLFEGLRMRAENIKPGGKTYEATMIAGVFGLTALPGFKFQYTKTLFPRAAVAASSCGTTCSTTSSWTSSGCGSSCGSSCGGGCGGGCGGCGS